MSPYTEGPLESLAPTQVSESPFPDTSMSFVGEESETEEEQKTYSDSYQLDSPFESIYELESEEGIVDPETEEVMEFLDELYDEEFDEALYELINEAEDLYQDRFEGEYYGDRVAQTMEAERLLEAHFAPLISETEALLEAMAEEIDRRDLNTLSEAEIDAFVDQYKPQTELSPPLEHLFGGLRKKFKKVAGKVGKLARRGIKAVGKFALRRILRKLKRLIMPLLRKVLKTAINKLPEKYRPLAQKLAKRFLKRKVETEADEEGDDATQDVAEIQREFDAQIANLLFVSEDVEQEVAIAEYVRESQQPATYDALSELHRARDQFIRQLNQLEEGENPAPYIENFIPALLPVLKLGLKLIGRRRVVEFLAKFLAKLIEKLVGKQNSRPLSRAIMDAGLRLLIGLEVTPEDEAEAAGAAVAYLVEDTMRQVAALSDYILDDQELLEGYALKAFENAARENLPPVLSDKVYKLRPELRETTGIKGTWVLLPLGSEKRYKYKKYTRIFDIKISPHTARVVKVCCGTPLMVYLRDRLGLSPGKTIKARVHLYQAIPGTLRSQICKHEKHVPGLGMRSAYSHLHLLTPVAAGMLLGQAGLGREVSPKYFDHRPMVAVGQRFYYLEIPEALTQMMMMPGGMTAARHSSQVYLTLNFPADRIRALIYLSEAEAQAMAMKLRQRTPMGMVMVSLKSILDYKLKTALSGSNYGHVKIVHGAVTPEQSRGPALKLLPQMVRENLTQKLMEWLGLYLSKHLQERRQDFIAATENREYGVTLVVTLNNPPGFAILRKALRGEPVSLYSMGFSEGMPDVHIKIVPGYYRD